METLNILELVSFTGEKPRSQTLFQGSGSRVMLLCVSAGQNVPEHSAAGPITVQALSGRATFYDGVTPFEMKAGSLLRLEASRPHRIEAQTDTALLVTIFGPPV